jgi:hypothetical protein
MDEQAILAALEAVAVPQFVRAFNDPEVDALRRQLDGLPDATVVARAELLQSMEAAVEDEDARHRDRLFAHLSEQRRIAPVPARPSLGSLTAEISELSRQLCDLQLPPLALVSSDADDAPQLRLRRQLDALRLECRIRIRDAAAAAERARHEVEAEIDAESANAGSQLQAELQAIAAQAAVADRLFEQQRGRRTAAAAAFETDCETLAAAQASALVERHRRHAAAVPAWERSIAAVRRSEAEDRALRERVLADNRARFEAEHAAEELAMLAELHNARSTEGEADARLAEATALRNQARERAAQRPMGKEEASLLQKLERSLVMRTQQLASVGRDLIEYRHRLIWQEGEYNVRFGVDPKVAILASKAVNKRPTTELARRLPRLMGSVRTGG